MINSAREPDFHTFDNGLRWVLDPVSGLRTFALTVMIYGGARFEAEHQSGWAHLLEHMVFKGAGGRNARELAEAIEARGGTINASTGYEHTRFEVRGLIDLLPTALQIVADMMYRPHMDNVELGREKDVVEQEISEAYDTPDDHVFDLLQATMFQGQILGRPILGTRQSLQDVDDAALSEFAQCLYAPQNVVICLSGGFDATLATHLIANSFAHVPKSPQLLPVSQAKFTSGVCQEQRNIEQANLTFAFKGLNRFEDDLVALRLLSEILGGGMASRLFQEAREERGLAYAIDAFVTPYRDTGVFGIYAGCAPKAVKPLQSLIFSVMQDLASTCRQDELDRAKAQYLTSLCLSHESAGSRSGLFASQVSTYGRRFSMDEMAQTIEKVQVLDIRCLAEQILSANHIAKAFLGPKSMSA